MKKSGFLSTSLVCVGLSFASMFNFVLAAPLPDRATKCQTRENGSQYRCAKDNYYADTIQVINVSNEKVWFDADKWVSFCGREGNFLGKDIVTLDPGKSK